VFAARTPDVHDPLVVRLHYRFGQRPWQDATLHEGSAARGSRVVAVPRPEGARRVEYLYSLEAPDGAVVARIGTEDAPLRLDLSRHVGRSETPPSGGERGDGTPWYERWYLWAGAAGVVAGTVVVVLLAQGDDTGAIRIQLQ
jgi:hypothetical protein